MINKKEDFNGNIAQTIQLAEEAENPREMMRVLSNGNKKEFLSQQHAQKIRISEEKNRNNEKYDFSALGIGE